MIDNTRKWQKPKEVEVLHKDVIVEIGQKLEKLRITKGLSVSGLAKELGISRNAYRQMERGEIYFSIYNFLKVLDYHGIDLTNFIKTNIENL